jgi:uncharacterized protein YgiM (DUF1202 family)
MKARYWSLAAVFILINYLVFATLFTRLVETDFTRGQATPVPRPTFTPAPAEPIIIVPTPVPVTPQPTPTATRVMEARSGSNAAVEGAQANAPPAEPVQANPAQLIAPGPVNIRSGPGLNFDVIGTLNANTAMSIIGRNADASWWQINITDNTNGWVANSVVNATNTESVPVTETASGPRSSASTQAQPAADSSPPPAPRPEFQFEPTGWWGDTNQALTRFLGDIKDVKGNPVNGVSVQARCGDYSIISNPSGPVGRGNRGESATWPDGFYDLTVDDKPVPCIWVLTIVETDDGNTVKTTLSESIPVEVTLDSSIVVANWRKNW